MDLAQRGSQTARDGFRNEDKIIEKFNNWEFDKDARQWLILMSYNLDKIEYVKAVKIAGYKTDVQVQVTIKLKEAIDIENLQVKLVSNNNGFNQIDKRCIENYQEMWQIPNNIVDILKRYTGEIEPDIDSPRDKRRMFANEFAETEQKKIISWLEDNKALIVSDILKGQGKFAAEWMLVANKNNINSRWILKTMNYCMNFFGNGDIVITRRGNFKIGKITMQRKGGDAGRKTAQMLQFKINPALLFEAE